MAIEKGMINLNLVSYSSGLLINFVVLRDSLIPVILSTI